MATTTTTKKRKTQKVPFGRKAWVAPKGFKKVLTTDTGDEFNVTVKFGLSTIKVPIKCCGLVVRKSGKPVKLGIEVPTTTVSCKVGTVELKARSCCKPPDKFEPEQGIYIAVKRLFANDSDSIITDAGRAKIMRVLCPWRFKK